MSDIFDREAKEVALVRVLAREFSRARLALLGLIPELPTWTLDVDPGFWLDHERGLISGIRPQLESVYVAQAETLMDEFAFLGVDWGLVNTTAAEWAREYTFDFVKQITATSKGAVQLTLDDALAQARELQISIAEFFEQRQTLDDLRRRLAGTFGPRRASVIARTEVTRAAVEGEPRRDCPAA